MLWVPGLPAVFACHTRIHVYACTCVCVCGVGLCSGAVDQWGRIRVSNVALVLINAQCSGVVQRLRDSGRLSSVVAVGAGQRRQKSGGV